MAAYKEKENGRVNIIIFLEVSSHTEFEKKLQQLISEM